MSILPKTSMERRYVSTPTYGDVAYVDWGSGPDAQECIASMEPSEMTAIRDGLARFAKPTLIVWGADDVFFPVKWARWLEATIPGVTRSVTVEGARLFFPLERPAEFNRELRRFWDAAPVQEADAEPSPLDVGRDASFWGPGR